MHNVFEVKYGSTGSLFAGAAGKGISTYKYWQVPYSAGIIVETTRNFMHIAAHVTFITLKEI
jgi:hypothetical protein